MKGRKAMAVKVDIDAGVCGFRTTARVASEDSQHVTFDIQSDCGKVRAFAAILKKRGPVDAFQEISPESESVVLSSARDTLKGCCAACAVPVAVFKAMQVAAGLALPRDIVIRLEKE